MTEGAGPGVVAVAGEALVDFVPAGADGVFRAAPGGSPANVAVGLARLEVPTRLLARIADDLLGHRLRAHLDDPAGAAHDPRLAGGGEQAGRAEGDDHHRGALGQPGLGDLLWGPTREQPGQVVGAGLDHVGQGDQALDAAPDGLGGAHQQRPAVGVVGDGHGLAGVGQQPLEHVGARRHGQGQRPGVQGHHLAVEGAGELGVAPLPVGRALDSEVVLDHAVAPHGHDGQRGRLGRPRGERQVDPVAVQVGPEPVAEQVVGDPGQQPGGHLQAGQPDGHVRRAPAGRGPEHPVGTGGHEVHQRLPGHRDHPGPAPHSPLAHLPSSSSRRPARAPQPMPATLGSTCSAICSANSTGCRSGITSISVTPRAA